MQRLRRGSEENCGKGKIPKNCDECLLTSTVLMVILEGSLQATLRDREAEQTLFDNRYDVPESVRPHLVEPNPLTGGGSRMRNFE